MDDKQKAQSVFAALLFTPAAAWFITAKAVYGFTPQDVRQRLPYLFKNTFELWPLWSALLVGVVLGIVIAVLIVRLNRTVFAGAHFDKFYRGTKLTSAKDLARETTDRKLPQITIAAVPVPVDAENTHFSIGGATGTGKSTIFKEMMFGLLQRGDRMVVTDPDGEFLSAFYRPGKDKILNPYDSRTEGWNFFNEMQDDYDFERYAKSIIQPSDSSESEEWNDYGRMLFREVARKLFNTSRQPTMRDVFGWTNQRPVEELEAFVKGTAAQALFTGNTRATSSVRFVLSNKLSPHLKMPDGPFSLRDWLADPNGGNLFITWDENMREALHPMISCWVDTIFTSVLGMPVDHSRRIWTFLDELESLDRLPTLGDALTKGRKKGLSVVTGYQSYTQLVRIYGDELAETLLSNHRTTVAMAVGRMGEKTADRLSKALGEHEVMRRKQGTSRRWGQMGTRSENEEVKTERVVSVAEIMALPNLEGFLAFPGNLPVAKYKTEPVTYTRAEPVPGILRTDRVFS
ncbi:type IV secretion system DNA-binding domain-containing protein (plasmid) [Xanthomonas hortorum pv. vitians]|uniref:type IV secretion system DNA-binding domain-containing protein n=1 Tax=Xanthomonas hortorum TaxID=56454 RepID=UPI0009382B07|nr:type IV secretion system DNA-binding domain-containing protein [Xanthomonas hortorum]APP87396.1 conjugal transfer protein TraJ [Xanthomonas hortorum pv. gardneri]ASW48754.1 conjugal transfer protein TraJ [Xanthomonas hortorum]MCE4307371.1 type IV secretion system DNA-binding domain-containing protein [Xanthomonas hortorum pv. vitians]MCE4312779.1 type IV secretion system DNA-binding domain-containing protein [Xanthomonas hortorum pv. vitians]MCE4338177.1 type IV secretion system DNA-binding